MSMLPAEHLGAAIRTGVRYVRNEANIATVIVRLGGVMLFAAANGALMPVLARQRVKVSAGQFGLLTTATGVGAVVASLLLPRIRAKVGPDLIATVGGLVLAGALIGLGVTTTLVPFTAVLVVAGIAQLCVFSTTFSTAQAVLPNWVRGRSLALAMLVVQGTTVVASIGWGALMSARGAPLTLTVAGVGLAVVTIAMIPMKLAGRSDVDLTPAPSAWPHPHTTLEVDADRGPVLVNITYSVRPESADDFVSAMHDVGRQRRRNGAMSWGIYEVVEHRHGDDEQPTGSISTHTFLESFALATWIEHEREQQRRTANDAALHLAARTHLVAGIEPPVEHYLAPIPGHRRTHRGARPRRPDH